MNLQKYSGSNHACVFSADKNVILLLIENIEKTKTQTCKSKFFIEAFDVSHKTKIRDFPVPADNFVTAKMLLKIETNENRMLLAISSAEDNSRTFLLIYEIEYSKQP